MAFIAVLAVVFVVAFFVAAKRKKLPEPMKVSLIAGGVLGVMLGTLLAIFIGMLLPLERSYAEAIELGSFNGSGGAGVGYFVGIVKGRSADYYIFWPLAEERFREVRKGEIAFEEEERQGGILKKYTEGFSHTWHWLFAIHAQSGGYEFRVPFGGVVVITPYIDS